MREILFRGKRVGNDEWVYGYYVELKYDGGKLGKCGFIYPCTEANYISVAVDPKTIGQYTGLKDKNGNKIFEGDIISASYESPLFDGYHNATFTHIGAVRYNPNICTLIVDNKKQGFCLGELNDYEVVSNIHDNPELLEVE